MLKKFTNKKGFTLMEMLIVVAIIAILVAIAIPTFSGALNKARASTDLANIRSGYASAQITAMTEDSVAVRVLYLQRDGTVKDTADDAYICKASKTDAGEYDKIGGRLDVDWEKGKKITYTIDAKTNTVSAINIA